MVLISAASQPQKKKILSLPLIKIQGFKVTRPTII